MSGRWISKCLVWLSGLGAMASSIVAVAARAEIVQAGPQVQIADVGSLGYAAPQSLAVREDGRFVVGWNVSADLFPRIRVFDPDASPRSAEITLPQRGLLGAVAFTSPDRFLVTWPGTDRAVIFLEAFTADGVPLGPPMEFAETLAGVDYVTATDLEPTGDGGTVLVFAGVSTANGSYVSTIQSVLVDASGEPIGGPNVVAQSLLGDQRVTDAPQIARASDGFLVTWQVEDQTPTNLPPQAWARPLGMDGKPRGLGLLVDLTGYAPRLAPLPDDEFMIAYERWNNPGVFLNRLNASGLVQGLPSQLGTSAASAPLLASNAKAVVAAWESFSDAGGSVVARDLDIAGTPSGAEVRFNDSGDPVAYSHAIGLTSAGRIVAAWTSRASTPSGDAYSIQVQLARVLCTDADADGYATEGGSCGPVDCNDHDLAVNPGTTEIPGDGIDNDCNTATPGGCSSQLATASTERSPYESGGPRADLLALALALFGMRTLTTTARRRLLRARVTRGCSR